LSSSTQEYSFFFLSLTAGLQKRRNRGESIKSLEDSIKNKNKNKKNSGAPWLSQLFVALALWQGLSLN